MGYPSKSMLEVGSSPSIHTAASALVNQIFSSSEQLGANDEIDSSFDPAISTLLRGLISSERNARTVALVALQVYEKLRMANVTPWYSETFRKTLSEGAKQIFVEFWLGSQPDPIQAILFPDAHLRSARITDANDLELNQSGVLFAELYAIGFMEPGEFGWIFGLAIESLSRYPTRATLLKKIIFRAKCSVQPSCSWMFRVLPIIRSSFEKLGSKGFSDVLDLAEAKVDKTGTCVPDELTLGTFLASHSENAALNSICTAFVP
ncbi:hypothetical protein DFP72DRAFT_848551 [Ephemerocybe angulata]|uniref:Uncharacterized protein n=1 Tax=Ephemerocybe angulata TaxID=980116 RepID=A0A8H6HX69_9AGAR|nr:hypothetical protein DFP72DRAFT_848551 [Tulosesus angulatus]